MRCCSPSCASGSASSALPPAHCPAGWWYRSSRIAFWRGYVPRAAHRGAASPVPALNRANTVPSDAASSTITDEVEQRSLRSGSPIAAPCPSERYELAQAWSDSAEPNRTASAARVRERRPRERRMPGALGARCASTRNATLSSGHDSLSMETSNPELSSRAQPRCWR
jgi:hypothetical protein